MDHKEIFDTLIPGYFDREYIDPEEIIWTKTGLR